MVMPQPTLFPFPFQLSLDSIELLEERTPYRMVVLRQLRPLTYFQSRHLRLKNPRYESLSWRKHGSCKVQVRIRPEECQLVVEDEYGAASDVIEVPQPRRRFICCGCRAARSRNYLFAPAGHACPKNARMPTSAPTLGSRKTRKSTRKAA